MADPKFNERRQHKRVPDSFMVTYRVRSPFNVRIKFGEKECDAVANDISEGGIGLVTNHEIPLGSRVLLKFTIYGGGVAGARKFEPEGEVRYGTFQQGKDYKLGVRFLQISMADRIFIADYVKSQDLQPGPDS